MSRQDLIDQLKSLLVSIDEIDDEKLLRPTLGEVSLSDRFADDLAQIKKDLAFAIQYAPYVRNGDLENIRGYYQNISSLIQEQVRRSPENYVTAVQPFLNDIRGNLEGLKQFDPPFICAAIKERGFLDDEGIRRAYESTVQSIKQEAKNSLRGIKDESKSILEEAEQLAKRIEGRARLTASGISVEKAQKQFREAQASINMRVKIWAGLSGLCSLAFIGVVIYFMFVEALPEMSGWSALYYTAIRITMLTAVGTTAAFCLRILRAHLHMSEKNRHRQRVANSIDAFVQSAVTPEQRDLILSQLVESVIQFGNSGLLQRGDDNLYRPKMTVDAITRAVSGDPRKD